MKDNMDHNQFEQIKDDATRRLPQILQSWLPDGKRHGNEWVARNPTRNDKNPGSFSINIKTGQWIDFATRDKGGSVIALAMYLHGDRSPYAAAENLARMMGFKP
jgi:hypothetical protein